MTPQGSDRHLQPRRNLRLAGQVCAAAKKRFEFAEKACLRSVGKLFTQVDERAADKRMRPALLISLFFVRGGYVFGDVTRLDAFNICVEKDEFVIAASLEGVLAVPNVRHVVLD